jgi:hypothetical protein
MPVPGGLISLFAITEVAGYHTFDTSKNFSGATSSVSTTFTCASDATILILPIWVGSAVPRTGGAPTYNGIALTQVPSGISDFGETTSELWYLLNPPVGSAYTLSIPNIGTRTIDAAPCSFISSTGATAYDTSVTGGSVTASATPSNTITTGAAGCVVVEAHGSGYDSVSTSNNQTLLYKNDAGSLVSGFQRAFVPTPAATTFSWVYAGADDYTSVLGSFKPA